MKRTSEAYLTTLDTRSVDDMLALQLIRRTVSLSNKKNPTNKKRVVVRGRKPIVKTEVYNRWTGKMTRSGYDFGGNVVGGIANALIYDIYIYDRY